MMTKKTKLGLSLLTTVSLLSVSASAAEISTNAALMQAMDKVTGRVNKVTVPVNSKISYGDFSLVLRACKKRSAEETPENFAFIDVTDKSFGKEEYNIFRGWVLSSTPGISAIEHPIYDMWLLECIDTDVDKEKLLSEAELEARDKIPAKETLVAQNETVEPAKDENNEVSDKEEPKVIKIKEFIQEDKDIEKNIKEIPTYISETPSDYISDIEEGEEPENLLLFTKIQELEAEKASKNQAEETQEPIENELSRAIDAEINSLQD